jgi:hypothetical protein
MPVLLWYYPLIILSAMCDLMVPSLPKQQSITNAQLYATRLSGRLEL